MKMNLIEVLGDVCVTPLCFVALFFMFIRLASSLSMGPIIILKHNCFISSHATLVMIFLKGDKSLHFP